MDHWIERFENLIICILIGLMVLCISAATVELGVILVKGLLLPPYGLLDLSNLMEVLGFFLMVVVALELLETIKAYREDHDFHVEIVILAAVVAVARKVIVLDANKSGPETYYGLAAVLVALAIAYFFVKRVARERRLDALAAIDRAKETMADDGAASGPREPPPSATTSRTRH